MTKRVAILGAGLAGLACAKELIQNGFNVTVFEKSRGVGGRMSTRWLDRDTSPAVGFDHGAQYFHAESQYFRDFLLLAQKFGAVSLWTGRFVHLSYGQEVNVVDSEARWVGTPGMASLAKYLSQGVDLLVQAKVISVERTGEHYTIRLTKTDGTNAVQAGFDFVVSAMPAEQTTDLFSESAPKLAELSRRVESNVTWTGMASFKTRLPVNFDGAFVMDSPLGWICRDSSKPGRASGERWIIQAASDWSKQHEAYPQDAMREMMLDLFCSTIGKHVEPDSFSVHRWLYGLPSKPLLMDFYIDENTCLAACGDWLKGARVEDAYLSGVFLGQRLSEFLVSSAGMSPD